MLKVWCNPVKAGLGRGLSVSVLWTTLYMEAALQQMPRWSISLDKNIDQYSEYTSENPSTRG